MCRDEKLVREALKHNALLLRVTSGHEVWQMPDGGTFPIKSRGRRSNESTWKVVLGDLRRRLRGVETRRLRLI